MVNLCFFCLILAYAAADDMLLNAPYLYHDHKGDLLRGQIAVNRRMNSGEAVIILPDWDGANEYEWQRAQMLAELGYVAFVADIFGAEYTFVPSFNKRVELVMKWRDPGYCFGGSIGLTYSTHLGIGVRTMTSFHGGLGDNYQADNNALPEILVNSGGEDDLATSIAQLQNALVSARKPYQISRFGPNVVHSFTDWYSVPGTANLRYNPRVDSRSWTQFLRFIDANSVQQDKMCKSQLEAMELEYFDPFDSARLRSVLYTQSSGPSSLPLIIMVVDESSVADALKNMLSCKGFDILHATFWPEFADRMHVLKSNARLDSRLNLAIKAVKRFSPDTAQEYILLGHEDGATAVACEFVNPSIRPLFTVEVAVVSIITAVTIIVSIKVSESQAALTISGARVLGAAAFHPSFAHIRFEESEFSPASGKLAVYAHAKDDDPDQVEELERNLKQSSVPAWELHRFDLKEDVLNRLVSGSFDEANSCYPNCAKAETIPGPSSSSNWNSWLNTWTSWRTKELNKMNYNDTVFRTMSLWTSTSFMQPQMMAHDRYFFDTQTGKYTVDKYLDDLLSRFGGIDSVLVWPTYPNMGIDDRNQFDMIADMPGGHAGLAKAFDQFRSRGVHVLLPLNPWDVGLQPLPSGETMASMLAEAMFKSRADGFNGDTMQDVPQVYFDDAAKLGVDAAIEPELGGTVDTLPWTKLGWGYWTPYPYQPYVDRFKWLEHRRLTHISERWATDRTDGMQQAWFNGDGYETWENIWGIWNQISKRDEQAIMRVGAMARFVGGVIGGGYRFDSIEWLPYHPSIVSSSGSVFGSLWSTNDTVNWGPLPKQRRTAATRGSTSAPTLHAHSGSTYRVWTLVNRDTSMSHKFTLTVSPYNSTDQRCADLYLGQWMKPSSVNGLQAKFLLNIEAGGFGTVLCLPLVRANSDQSLSYFLGNMSALTSTPLSSYSTATPVLKQTMLVHGQSAPSPSPYSPPKFFPPTVNVSAASYTFSVTGIEIEGQSRAGVDFQYPWESSPQLSHYHNMKLGPFQLDKYPVTNRDWRDFVNAGYVPKWNASYLRHWPNDTSYPTGWAEKPVTWVSQEDAEAYCNWLGRRLPNEWEWQYAAQGTDGRLYPWGNSFQSHNVPNKCYGPQLPPPDDVGAHPSGASPFGAMDMVGNVWHWTNKAYDEHTAAASLRGGTCFYPSVLGGKKDWYFPNTYRLDQHGKLLLLAPGLDRSARIGFRCLKD